MTIRDQIVTLKTKREAMQHLSWLMGRQSLVSDVQACAEEIGLTPRALERLRVPRPDGRVGYDNGAFLRITCEINQLEKQLLNEETPE